MYITVIVYYYHICVYIIVYHIIHIIYGAKRGAQNEESDRAQPANDRLAQVGL